MIDPREAERAISSRRGRSTTTQHASVDCICHRRTPRSQSIKLNPTSVSIAEPTMDASMRRIHDAIESMRGGRSSAPIIETQDFDALDASGSVPFLLYTNYFESISIYVLPPRGLALVVQLR